MTLGEVILSVGLSSLIVPGLLALVLFAARHWIIAQVTGSVQHQFNERIEAVKSDLRNREAEIAALRANVLAGSAGRQALLDKRRFEAVEKVWATVNDLGRLRALSATVSIMNVKTFSERASDPKVQELLSFFGSGLPKQIDYLGVAKHEQPFLPELAWAYFYAYATTLAANHMLYVGLTSGIGDVHKHFSNKEGMQKVLKAVLPHQSKFIDEQEPNRYDFLLDEVKTLLLAELRKVLEGQEADQAAAKRSKDILDAINQVDKERAQQAVPNGLKA